MDIYELGFKKVGLKVIFYILLTFNFLILSAQEVNLSLEKNEIRLHEKLVFHIDFPMGYKREFKAFQNYLFPDIPDFIKEQTTFKETESGYRISQYYRPLQTGTFLLPDFSVRIRSQVYTFKGGIARIKSGKVSPRIPATDLTFSYTQPEALLDLKTSQKEIYSGQGLGIKVSLLISSENEAEISLKQMTKQRLEILQLLKSRNCMAEENSNISITLDTVRLKGKKYNRWTFAEVVVFPLDSHSFTIPSLPLEIIAYELNRSENGIERKPVSVKLFSTPIKVKLKAQPFKNVSIGNYKLIESISANKFKTGKSFTYTMVVSGEGNISSLPEPIILNKEILDIYPPKIHKEISFQNGKMLGSKSFTYFITPKEPGDYTLGDFIKFPFFNVENKRLDTLISKIPMKIKGESLKNTYISTNHPDDFYNSATSAPNLLKPLEKEDPLAFYVNILILMMLLTSAVIVIKK
jgi:hypothetical protein